MDTISPPPNVLPTLSNLTPGAHLCSLYETEEEHRALLTPFLRQGLEQGEKVLYIVDARTAETILSYLRSDGLDVEPFLKRGQLGILTVREAYMRDGIFDPERMIALLRASTEQAVTEGYPALRVTGEMTWALRGLPGSERLIEYEAKLNHFFPGSRCLALCQYDRRRFTPEVQLDILATHPMVAMGMEIHDNPYYLPPDAFLAKDRPEARLEQWLNNLAERKRTDATLHRAVHDRGERVKELTCLYKSARLLQDSARPTTDLLRDLVALLPPAWQYPEITAARITLEGMTAATSNFVETPWKQSVAFQTADGQRGAIEVVYLEEKPDEAEGPFLAEERDLINSLADRLVSFQERKQTEAALRESEEAFRVMASSAQDAIILLDQDGKIHFWNQAAERIFGYRADEVLGLGMHQTFVPGRFLEAFQKGWREFQLTGQGPVIGKTLELTALRRHGIEFPVELSVSAIQLGGRWHAVGILRDITTRVQGQEQLERLAALVESSEDAIIGKTLDGTVTSWNRAAEQLYGYTAQEMLGRSISTLVPSDRQQEGEDILERIRRGERIRPYDTVRVRKDGTLVQVSIAVSPVLDRAGRVVGASTITRDVTERRRLEASLMRQRDTYNMLSQSNQAIVRCPGREELFPEVCRIAVVYGRFRFAWIGLLSEDGRRVEPVARYGEDAGYVDQAHILVAPVDARAGGPSGRAIAAGQTVISNDFLSDPATEPWHEAARRAGVRSSAAFPIRLRGTVIGSINLYGGEPNFFTGDLLPTLEEMALDVSFALDHYAQAALLRTASQVVAASPVVLFRWRSQPGWPVEYVSENVERWGYPAATLLSGEVPFSRLVHPEDLPRVGDEVERYTREGRTEFQQEYRLVTADGRVLWVEDLTSVVRDGEGRVLRYEGVLTDITDRKRAEEVLRQAGAYNRSLIEASLDPLVTIGPDGAITDVNAATEAVTGYARQELIGTDFSTYFTEPEKARAGYQQVFREGLVRDYELEIRHRDGRETSVLYNASVYRDETGAAIGVFAAARDITERKRAEKQIRLVTHALESAANGIVIADPEGTILWVNPAFTKMTGYEAAEAIGQNPRLLKSGRQDQSFYERLWGTIKSGQVWHGEVVNKRKDGSLYAEEMTISPVCNDEGVIGHFVAVKQDITERKEMERHAQRMEQLALLGQLVGGIAHEIKNPLFIVSGYVRLIRDKLAAGEYALLPVDLDRIEEATKRMGGTVQRFLALAQPSPPISQPFLVQDILRQTLDFLGQEMLIKQVAIETDISPHLPTIQGDPRLLYDACLNLLVNAVQAMHSAHGKGRLLVTAMLDQTPTGSPAQPGPLAVGSNRQPDRWIEIRIQDDGPGIQPQHRSRLFEPFFSTKLAGQGTGLGLWIVRSNVATLGGTVCCDTELGQGTTFIVRLPIFGDRSPDAPVASAGQKRSSTQEPLP